jgi:hypothetical protein
LCKIERFQKEVPTVFVTITPFFKEYFFFAEVIDDFVPTPCKMIFLVYFRE